MAQLHSNKQNNLDSSKGVEVNDTFQDNVTGKQI